MQQIDRIDVLTTQLAETDRRALSQAWYSALHLAERSPREVYRTAANTAVAQSSSVARQPAPHGAMPHGVIDVHGASAPQRRAVANEMLASNRGIATEREAMRRRVATVPEAERRVPKTALARRLERTLIGRITLAGATSFALRAGEGRVHVLVRSDGARTRLIAVCVPSVRERVERALAQARFALAGRGVAAEVA